MSGNKNVKNKSNKSRVKVENIPAILEEIKDPVPLTMDDILADSDKYDQLKIVEFVEENKFTEVYTNISNKKINDMINDIIPFLGELAQHKQEHMGEILTDGEIQDYLNLYCVVYLSTLIADVPKSFEDKINLFDKLLLSDITEIIFNNLEKKDTQKVYDKFYKAMDNYIKLINDNVEYKKLFREKVKELGLDNQELIEKVILKDEVDNVNVSSGEVDG